MKIGILGDSSSSTLGDNEFIYPKILQKKLRNKFNTEFFNFAVPGATSADIYSIYLNHAKKINLDYLIIYIGNNDNVRGKPKIFKNKIILKIFQKIQNKDYQSFAYQKQKFSFNYSSHENSPIVSVMDFENFLSKIIEDSLNSKTKVILINPIANNVDFVGCGTRNFEFFKLKGYKEQIHSLLKSNNSEEKLLIKAIKFQELNKYNDAVKIYKKLLSSEKNISTVANNNLAIILSNKDPILATQNLKNILENCDADYRTLIFYNLYLINKKEKSFLKDAIINDHCSYKIKDEYRVKIKNLKKKYPIIYLDLENILNYKHFIDYCHPNKAGHNKIANFIYSNIKNDKLKKINLTKENFFNFLPSPDHFNDKSKSFFDYYNIEFPVSEKVIYSNLRSLIKQNIFKKLNLDFNHLIKKYKFKSFDLNLVNFLKENSKHPIFDKNLFKDEINFPKQNEIFNMPENYLIKLIYNYLYYLNNKNIKIFKKKFKLDHQKYKDMILSKAKYKLMMNIDLSSGFKRRILSKVRILIQNSKIFSNLIDLRKKTIMYWYTRETFLFGTLSRNSMLYDCVNLNKVIESLTVVYAINVEKNSKNNRVMLKIINFFHKVKFIHEKYIGQFIKYKYEINIQREYEKKLISLEKYFNKEISRMLN